MNDKEPIAYEIFETLTDGEKLYVYEKIKSVLNGKFTANQAISHVKRKDGLTDIQIKVIAYIIVEASKVLPTPVSKINEPKSTDISKPKPRRQKNNWMNNIKWRT